MPTLSIIFGIILITMGLIGYFGLGSQSITALIPAFLGLPVLILGVLGLNEKKLKVTMHIVSVLMLLGLLGTIRGLFKFFSMIGGTQVERPEAVTVQAIMAILCLIFLIFAVKSFIDARRNK
jgi:uncharacterized membrane protein